MSDLTYVAVICPGCTRKVLLADFQLSIEHCDDCEISASIEMQSVVTDEEAYEMACYYGEDA